MWISFALKLSVGLIEICIGTYVLIKAKRSPNVWLFFLSSFFLGIWLFAKSLYIVEMYFRDPIADNFILFFGSYMSAFTYLFILYFPSKYLPKLLHNITCISILSIYTFLAFATSFSGISHKLMPNGMYLPFVANNPFLYSMYFNIQFVSTFLIVLYWIYAYFKEPKSEEKKLVLFSAIAFILGRMGPGIFFNLYLVSIGVYNYINVIFGTSLIWQITFFYIICYRKAFNVRTAIHYTVFWLLISGIFVFPSIGIIKLSMYLNSLLGTYIGFNSSTISLLYIPLVAYIFLYFKWIQPFIDRWFFKHKYKLQDEFNTVCKKLSSTLSEFDFFTIVSGLLQRHLYIKEIVYYVYDETTQSFISKFPSNNKGPNTIANSDIVYKYTNSSKINVNTMSLFNYIYIIKNNHQNLGLLCLSETRHLKEITKNEHDFIQNLCNVSGSYLNNIRLYSQLEKQHTNLINTQNSLLESERTKTSLFEQKNYIQKLSCGIIHEVKNTNLSIEGLIKQVLQNNSNNSSLILKAIGKQSNKLVNFSSNFLYNELIETQQIKIDISLINLKELITKSINNNMIFTKEENFKVITKLNSPNFYFDSNKLHLIINNIIHNTEKYSGKNASLIISSFDHDSYITLRFKHFSSCVNKNLLIADESSINATGLGLKISKKLLNYLKSDLVYKKKSDYFLTELKLYKGFKLNANYINC
jgi:hypothetical protein